MSNSLSQLYVNDLKDSLERWGCWYPNEKYSLGDIGVIEDGLFSKTHSLAGLPGNISWEQEVAVDCTDIMSFSSQQGFSYSVGASAAVDPNLPSTPNAKLEARLKFGKEGAFYFTINNFREFRVKNFYNLAQFIFDLYENGMWEKEWVLITQILVAERGTFFISESAESEMVFSIGGELRTSVIDFGDANANFSLKHQEGRILKIEQGTNITPTFKLAKIKGNVITGSIFSTAMGIKGKLDPLDFINSDLLKKHPEFRQMLEFNEFL